MILTWSLQAYIIYLVLINIGFLFIFNFIKKKTKIDSNLKYAVFFVLFFLLFSVFSFLPWKNVNNDNQKNNRFIAPVSTFEIKREKESKENYTEKLKKTSIEAKQRYDEIKKQK